MEKRKPITSDRSISSHKAEAKEYLVPVKGRPKLYLMVRPNETKSWLFRYTSPNTGKSQRISFGIYPSITLARAHDIWQEYQDLLSKNIASDAGTAFCLFGWFTVCLNELVLHINQH